MFYAGQSDLNAQGNEDGNKNRAADRADQRDPQEVVVGLAVRQLGDGEGALCGGALGQGIQTDGGDADQTVQSGRRDAGGQELVAQRIERDAHTGRGGAADAGRDVDGDDDLEGLRAGDVAEVERGGGAVGDFGRAGDELRNKCTFAV